jgi:hypothetical protein
MMYIDNERKQSPHTSGTKLEQIKSITKIVFPQTKQTGTTKPRVSHGQGNQHRANDRSPLFPLANTIWMPRWVGTYHGKPAEPHRFNKCRHCNICACGSCGWAAAVHVRYRAFTCNPNSTDVKVGKESRRKRSAVTCSWVFWSLCTCGKRANPLALDQSARWDGAGGARFIKLRNLFGLRWTLGPCR